MNTMKALVKEGRSVGVRMVPRPMLTRNGEAIIRVVKAGICRTDLYVAEGRMKCIDPLILGHEFSGVVCDAGDAAGDLAPDQRVTAMPVIPCGECDCCRAGQPSTCQAPTMLGIDHHGAFAVHVKCPAAITYPPPDTVSSKAGAST